MATAELTKLKSSLGSVSKDAASATTQMAKVGDSAGGIGSKISGATKALGAFGLAGMGISSLTGVAKGLGNALGLGLANQMEQTRAQMMAFYKDAGVVETELAKVKKEAASTPFAFNEIATAFAQLGPTAKAAGKDTLELTRIAEALAASNPMQGFEGAVFSLKEAVSGDMTSIIERFNLSRSAIKRFKDEGKTDLEAVQAAMAEQGITYDLVAAQSQTMTGRWSTFVDTINEVKMAIAAPIFEALKKSLVGMQAGLESALPTLQRFGQIAGEGIAKGITLLGQAITAAAPAVKNFIAVDVVPRVQAFADILISPVLPAVRDVAGALGDLAGAGKRLTDSLGGVGPVLLAVGAALGGLLIITTIAGAISGMVATVGGLVAAFTAMSTAIGPVTAIVAILGGPLTLAIVGIGAAIAVLVLAWTQNWGDIQGKTQAVIAAIRPVLDALGDRLREFGRVILPELVAAWQNLSDQVGTIANGIRAVVEPVFDGIRSFLEAHRTEITTIVQGAWDAISVIVNTITGVISNAIQFWLNVLQGDWSGAWQNVKNTVEIVWNGIKDLIQIAIDTIPVILRVGMAATVVVLQAAWDLIKDTLIPGAWTAIKAAVQAGIDAIPPILRAGMQLAIDALQVAWNFVKDTLIPLAWQGIMAAVQVGIDAVVALLVGMKDRFLTALSDIGSWLWNAGWSLLHGMIEGAQSLGQQVIDAVTKPVEDAIKEIWELIKPGSPSEEGRAMIVNLFQGMMAGAGEMGGALKAKMVSMAQEAFDALKKTVADAGGAILGPGVAPGGPLSLGGGGWVDQAITYAASRTGVPAALIAAIAATESQFGANQNGGTAFGLFQVEPRSHGGTPESWMGPEGAIRGADEMGPRWASAFAALGGMAAYQADPVGFYQRFQPAAQGSIGISRQQAEAAMAAARARGYAKGGKAPYGWGIVGEEGWERFHYGPEGLTIFPHDVSRAMGPMAGGRGYAAGSGATPGGSRGDNTQAELFAAFAAGTNTPETWGAWTKGLQQIAQYMADEAEAIAESERQLAQVNLGAELRRFAEWVRQFGDQWLKSLVETEGVEAAFRAYHGRSSPSMAMVGAGSIQNPDAVVQRLDQLIVAVEAMTDRPVYVSPAEVGRAARDYETAYYRSRH